VEAHCGFGSSEVRSGSRSSELALELALKEHKGAEFHAPSDMDNSATMPTPKVSVPTAIKRHADASLPSSFWRK